MKKILSVAFLSLSISVFATSCAKEYVCECENGTANYTITSESRNEASTTCQTTANKTSCKLQ